MKKSCNFKIGFFFDRMELFFYCVGSRSPIQLDFVGQQKVTFFTPLYTRLPRLKAISWLAINRVLSSHFLPKSKLPLLVYSET